MSDVTFRLSGATVIIHDNDRNDSLSRGDTVEVRRPVRIGTQTQWVPRIYTARGAELQLRNLGITPSWTTQFAPLRRIAAHLDNAWTALNNTRTDNLTRFGTVSREAAAARTEMLRAHIYSAPTSLNLWRPVGALSTRANNFLRAAHMSELRSQAYALLTGLADGTLRGQRAFDQVAAVTTRAATFGMSDNSYVVDANTLVNHIYQAGLYVRNLCQGNRAANDSFTDTSAQIQTMLTRLALPTARLEELNRQRANALANVCP